MSRHPVTQRSFATSLRSWILHGCCRPTRTSPSRQTLKRLPSFMVRTAWTYPSLLWRAGTELSRKKLARPRLKSYSALTPDSLSEYSRFR